MERYKIIDIPEWATTEVAALKLLVNVTSAFIGVTAVQALAEGQILPGIALPILALGWEILADPAFQEPRYPPQF